MQATMTKTQNAPVAGQYQPTAVDAAKHGADFRVVNVSPYFIRWKDGRTEQVTARQLLKLQDAYTWASDF